MRKLEVIKEFVDKELKEQFLKEGDNLKIATKRATRTVEDVFETTDERASILLNLKYVKLITKIEMPDLDSIDEVKPKRKGKK